MHISKLLLLIPFLAAAASAVPVLAERSDLSEDCAKGYTRSLETRGCIKAKREPDVDNAMVNGKRAELSEDCAKGYTRSLDKRGCIKV